MDCSTVLQEAKWTCKSKATVVVLHSRGGAVTELSAVRLPQSRDVEKLNLSSKATEMVSTGPKVREWKSTWSPSRPCSHS